MYVFFVLDKLYIYDYYKYSGSSASVSINDIYIIDCKRSYTLIR